ncbi:hypothetical protein ACSFCT_09305 [Yokenella regensburgei]|uniref:hypothetical protein n=1 Tax=Yokenella regensburgei TaxID=158877 RepID=UPI003ED8EB50
MNKLLIVSLSFILSGCINVYGPAKMGARSEQDNGQQNPGMSDGLSVTKIGNRKPDELINAIQLYYQQKGLNIDVSNAGVGIIASTGHDDELADLLLDCSMLAQTQNIQEQYRIVSQVWSAGEGSNVSVEVTGVAGLTAADGNDKVKPVECKSTGTFEKDLLERLHK